MKITIILLMFSFSITQDTLKSNIPLVGEKFIKAGNLEYYSRISDVIGLIPISYGLSLYSTNQIGNAGKIVIENDNGLNVEFGEHLIKYKNNKYLYPLSFVASFAILSSMNTSRSKANKIIPLAWITYCVTLHFSISSLRNLNRASISLNQFSDNYQDPYLWEASRNFDNYNKINFIGSSLFQFGFGAITYYALKTNYSEKVNENNYIEFMGYSSMLTGIFINKVIAPWFLRNAGQYLVKVNNLKL